jgi:hypothetical protein
MTGGGADFSPYGVATRYKAGREAIDAHFGHVSRLSVRQAAAVALEA